MIHIWWATFHPLTKVQCNIVPIVITPTFPSSKLISQQVLVNDAQTTTIRPIHVASETNKEWRNSQSLDNEKEGKAHYYHLHLDPKFFFLLGDPTSYSKYICAYILICVRKRSILTRPRAVAFLPPTLDHIKEDIATLRDETTYPLRSFWYRTSTTIKCTVTQTKETINSPVRFDVQTECSVHLQLTD